MFATGRNAVALKTQLHAQEEGDAVHGGKDGKKQLRRQ